MEVELEVVYPAQFGNYYAPQQKAERGRFSIDMKLAVMETSVWFGILRFPMVRRLTDPMIEQNDFGDIAAASKGTNDIPKLI